MGIVGIILSLAAIKGFSIEMPLQAMVLGSILILPMPADGCLQYFGKISSTNPRRAITGFLFGVGATFMVEYWF